MTAISWKWWKLCQFPSLKVYEDQIVSFVMEARYLSFHSWHCVRYDIYYAPILFLQLFVLFAFSWYMRLFFSISRTAPSSREMHAALVTVFHWRRGKKVRMNWVPWSILVIHVREDVKVFYNSKGVCVCFFALLTSLDSVVSSLK